jgi:glucose-1-phosphatase
MISAKIIPFSEQNPDAIIFDLGGVLLKLDTQRSIDAFRKLGFTDIEDHLNRIINKNTGEGNPGLFQLYETGEITNAEFRKGLCKYAGRKISDADIDNAWSAMLLGIPPGNIRLLEALGRSYRLFLLSNTNDLHIARLMNNAHFGNDFSTLISLFDRVYYSHEVKMRKPHTEIYLHVIEDAGLNPGSTLFIDDSKYNVEGAMAAGLLGLHHKRNASLEPLFLIT